MKSLDFERDRDNAGGETSAEGNATRTLLRASYIAGPLGDSAIV